MSGLPPGDRSFFWGVSFIQRFQLLFGITCAVIHIDEPHGEIPTPAVTVPIAQEDREDVLIRRRCLAVHVGHPLIYVILYFITESRELQLNVNFSGKWDDIYTIKERGRRHGRAERTQKQGAESAPV